MAERTERPQKQGSYGCIPVLHETETVTYTRPKRKSGKLDEMLKGLPTRTENHELTNEELIEIFGENGWKRLPDDIYRKLEYHPATKEIVEHHAAVYAARNEDKIVRAPHHEELLVHSVATPSIVATIMNARYTNAMPLYRIDQESDAYSGYHSLDRQRDDIQVANCWAHCRRSFADALKLLKKRAVHPNKR